MTGQAAGLVGDQVVIAASTAARLAPALRAAAARARRDGLVLDDDLVQVLDVLAAAERALQRRPAGAPGTTLDAGGSTSACSERSLGVADVAHLAGVTGRAVRKAAAAGRLVGRLGPDGRWWFHPDDVTKWQANRRRSSA